MRSAPLLLALLLASASRAQPITVDPTFGTNGFVMETYGGDRGSALDVERLADGRIVVLGSRGGVVGQAFVAARFLPNGAPDPSFGGGDGVVILPVGPPRVPGETASLDARGGAEAQLVTSERGYYLINQGSTWIQRVTLDGEVDATFGSGGMAVINDSRLFRIHDVVETADGAIWLTGSGYTQPGLQPRFLLARLTPAGQLDATYGSGGIALFGSTLLSGNVLVPMSGGRLLLVGNSVSAAGNVTGFAVARFLADGTLDASYGTDGFFLSNDFGEAATATIDGQGRLVVAGTIGTAASSDYYLARLTSLGAFDPTFDGDGSRTINVGNNDRFEAVTVLPTGRILAAGSMRNSRRDAAFGLFNPDGSSVAGFGQNGVSTFFFGPGSGWFSPVWDFAVQPDGRVVAVGSPQQQGTLQAFGVTRLRLGLSFVEGGDVLDPDFGEGGVVLTDAGGDDGAIEVIDLPDGGILTVGGSSTGLVGAQVSAVVLAEYLPGGALNPTFGTGGIVRYVPDGTLVGVTGAVRDADGRVVVIGAEVVGGVRYVLLIRFLPDGSLDPSFGTGGVVRYNHAGLLDYGWSVKLLPDGKLVVLVVLGTAAGDRLAVLRFHADGTLDTSFGNGGRSVLTPLTGGRGLVLLPDGKIVVGGWGPGGIGLVRYLADGTLDATFGAAGVAIVDPGGQGFIRQVRLLPDGALLAAGDVAISGDSDGILVRFTADGELDAAFGTGGYAFVRFAAGGFNFDTVNDVLALGDGRLFVAGGSTGRDVGDLFAFVSAFTAGGVLDPSFGAGGTLALDFSAGADVGQALRLVPGGKVVMAGSSGPSLGRDQLLVRFNPGNGGVATAPGPGRGTLALAVAPNPAAGRTAVTLRLGDAAEARVEVFDALGRRVALLHDGPLAAGTHTTSLDVGHLRAGVYVVRVATGGRSAAHRFTVAR